MKTKPPGPQSTVQPRVEAKPLSIQHTLPAVDTSQQTMTTPKPTPSVQTTIPQPYPVITNKPMVHQRSGDNNKAIPKASVLTPLTLS